MKRLKTILLFLVICISCFGQKSANDTTKVKEPSKFDGWIISDVCLEASWPDYPMKFLPKCMDDTIVNFSIAIDKKGFYYCVVSLFNNSKFYSINDQTLPHLYLKTNKEKIIDLKAESIFNFNISGKYVTKLIFFVPNIRVFVSEDYVKCRVWLGENNLIDINRRWWLDHSSLFSSLKDAEKEITSKYKIVSKYLTKPKQRQSMINSLEDF